MISRENLKKLAKIFSDLAKAFGLAEKAVHEIADDPHHPAPLPKEEAPPSRDKRKRVRSKAQKIRHHISDGLRKKVKDRDDNKCIRCGFKDKLTLHHIFPVSDFLSGKRTGKINTLNNLVTLCERCHVKIHKKEDLEIQRFALYISEKNVDSSLKTQ